MMRALSTPLASVLVLPVYIALAQSSLIVLVSTGSWQGAWPSVAGVIVAAAPIALLVAITCFSMQAAARASLRACSGGWHVHALVGAVLLAEHAALAAPQLVSAVPLLMGAQPYIAAVALVMLEGTPLMTLLQALAVLAVHSLSCFQQAQQAIRSGMFSVSSDGEQLGSASQQLEQQCSSQPERGHQDRHSQDDSMIHWMLAAAALLAAVPINQALHGLWARPLNSTGREELHTDTSKDGTHGATVAAVGDPPNLPDPPLPAGPAGSSPVTTATGVTPSHPSVTSSTHGATGSTSLGEQLLRAMSSTVSEGGKSEGVRELTATGVATVIVRAPARGHIRMVAAARAADAAAVTLLFLAMHWRQWGVIAAADAMPAITVSSMLLLGCVAMLTISAFGALRGGQAYQDLGLIMNRAISMLVLTSKLCIRMLAPAAQHQVLDAPFLLTTWLSLLGVAVVEQAWGSFAVQVGVVVAVAAGGHSVPGPGASLVAGTVRAVVWSMLLPAGAAYVKHWCSVCSAYRKEKRGTAVLVTTPQLPSLLASVRASFEEEHRPQVQAQEQRQVSQLGELPQRLDQLQQQLPSADVAQGQPSGPQALVQGQLQTRHSGQNARSGEHGYQSKLSWSSSSAAGAWSNAELPTLADQLQGDGLAGGVSLLEATMFMQGDSGGHAGAHNMLQQFEGSMGAAVPACVAPGGLQHQHQARGASIGPGRSSQMSNSQGSSVVQGSSGSTAVVLQQLQQQQPHGPHGFTDSCDWGEAPATFLFDPSADGGVSASFQGDATDLTHRTDLTDRADRADRSRSIQAALSGDPLLGSNHSDSSGAVRFLLASSSERGRGGAVQAVQAVQADAPGSVRPQAAPAVQVQASQLSQLVASQPQPPASPPPVPDFSFHQGGRLSSQTSAPLPLVPVHLGLSDSPRAAAAFQRARLGRSPNPSAHGPYHPAPHVHGFDTLYLQQQRRQHQHMQHLAHLHSLRMHQHHLAQQSMLPSGSPPLNLGSFHSQAQSSWDLLGQAPGYAFPAPSSFGGFSSVATHGTGSTDHLHDLSQGGSGAGVPLEQLLPHQQLLREYFSNPDKPRSKEETWQLEQLKMLEQTFSRPPSAQHSAAPQSVSGTVSSQQAPTTFTPHPNSPAVHQQQQRQPGLLQLQLPQADMVLARRSEAGAEQSSAERLRSLQGTATAPVQRLSQPQQTAPLGAVTPLVAVTAAVTAARSAPLPGVFPAVHADVAQGPSYSPATAMATPGVRVLPLGSSSLTHVPSGAASKLLDMLSVIKEEGENVGSHDSDSEAVHSMHHGQRTPISRATTATTEDVPSLHGSSMAHTPGSGTTGTLASLQRSATASIHQQAEILAPVSSSGHGQDASPGVATLPHQGAVTVPIRTSQEPDDAADGASSGNSQHAGTGPLPNEATKPVGLPTALAAWRWQRSNEPPPPLIVVQGSLDEEEPVVAGRAASSSSVDVLFRSSAAAASPALDRGTRRTFDAESEPLPERQALWLLAGDGRDDSAVGGGGCLHGLPAGGAAASAAGMHGVGKAAGGQQGQLQHASQQGSGSSSLHRDPSQGMMQMGQPPTLSPIRVSSASQASAPSSPQRAPPGQEFLESGSQRTSCGKPSTPDASSRLGKFSDGYPANSNMLLKMDRSMSGVLSNTASVTPVTVTGLSSSQTGRSPTPTSVVPGQAVQDTAVTGVMAPEDVMSQEAQAYDQLLQSISSPFGQLGTSQRQARGSVASMQGAGMSSTQDLGTFSSTHAVAQHSSLNQLQLQQLQLQQQAGSAHGSSIHGSRPGGGSISGWPSLDAPRLNPIGGPGLTRTSSTDHFARAEVGVGFRAPSEDRVQQLPGVPTGPSYPEIDSSSGLQSMQGAAAGGGGEGARQGVRGPSSGGGTEMHNTPVNSAGTGNDPAALAAHAAALRARREQLWAEVARISAQEAELVAAAHAAAVAQALAAAHAAQAAVSGAGGTGAGGPGWSPNGRPTPAIPVQQPSDRRLSRRDERQKGTRDWVNQTQLQHLASGSLSSPPSGPMPQMQVLQASQHYRVQQQQQQAGNTEAQAAAAGLPSLSSLQVPSNDSLHKGGEALHWSQKLNFVLEQGGLRSSGANTRGGSTMGQVPVGLSLSTGSGLNLNVQPASNSNLIYVSGTGGSAGGTGSAAGSIPSMSQHQVPISSPPQPQPPAQPTSMLWRTSSSHHNVALGHSFSNSSGVSSNPHMDLPAAAAGGGMGGPSNTAAYSSTAAYSGVGTYNMPGVYGPAGGGTGGYVAAGGGGVGGAGYLAAATGSTGATGHLNPPSRPHVAPGGVGVTGGMGSAAGGAMPGGLRSGAMTVSPHTSGPNALPAVPEGSSLSAGLPTKRPAQRGRSGGRGSSLFGPTAGAQFGSGHGGLVASQEAVSQVSQGELYLSQLSSVSQLSRGASMNAYAGGDAAMGAGNSQPGGMGLIMGTSTSLDIGPPGAPPQVSATAAATASTTGTATATGSSSVTSMADLQQRTGSSLHQGASLHHASTGSAAPGAISRGSSSQAARMQAAPPQLPYQAVAQPGSAGMPQSGYWAPAQRRSDYYEDNYGRPNADVSGLPGVRTSPDALRPLPHQLQQSQGQPSGFGAAAAPGTVQPSRSNAAETRGSAASPGVLTPLQPVGTQPRPLFSAAAQLDLFRSLNTAEGESRQGGTRVASSTAMGSSGVSSAIIVTASAPIPQLTIGADNRAQQVMGSIPVSVNVTRPAPQHAPPATEPQNAAPAAGATPAAVAPAATAPSSSLQLAAGSSDTAHGPDSQEARGPHGAHGAGQGATQAGAETGQHAGAGGDLGTGGAQAHAVRRQGGGLDAASTGSLGSSARLSSGKRKIKDLLGALFKHHG